MGKYFETTKNLENVIRVYKSYLDAKYGLTLVPAVILRHEIRLDTTTNRQTALTPYGSALLTTTLDTRH